MNSESLFPGDRRIETHDQNKGIPPVKRLSFLWIGLLFFGALHARTLTLDEALSQALRTHPDVKSALLQIQQSTQGVKAEESAWFPQVSIFAEYDPQRTYTMPMNGRLGVIDDDGWCCGEDDSLTIPGLTAGQYTVVASCYDAYADQCAEDDGSGGQWALRLTLTVTAR